MENIKVLIESYPSETVALGVGVLMLLVFVVLLYKVHKKTADSRMLRKVTKSLGGEFLRNIVLPDGMDGHVQLDYCIRTNNGLLVLNIQNFPGLLFGGENIDHWTQMYKNKSHKFENPLHYNQLCVEAVKQLLPGVEVSGRVVFTSEGSFPKGKPAGVSMLDELLKDLNPSAMSNEPQAEVVESWKSFHAMLKPSANAGWHLA